MPSTKRFRRREVLAAGAGGALAAATGRLGKPETSVARGRRRRTVDVAVVGAGLAGLSAARAVRRAGRSTVILEARDRVGGRTFDYQLPGGAGVAELGGEWAGPGQDRVLALADELGVATFPTFADGDSLYLDRSGQLKRYSGDIPPANPAALVELQASLTLLNEMAGQVPVGQPWQAGPAADWDQQSVAGWADSVNHTEEARDLLRLAIRGVYGEEAAQISLLDLLAAIAGVGGDINTLIGSAQTIRFVGGSQQLSIKLAKQLKRSLKLKSPVREIDWGHGVVLRTAKQTFHARRAILTPPKPLLAGIRYRPALPAAEAQVIQRQPLGAVTKVNAIYDTPFWRDQGLSGSAISTTGPIEIVYDNSPPSGRPGVLVGFMEGDQSRLYFNSSAPDRRQAALDSLARFFGDAARSPSGYVDMVWAAEPYTRGAYGSYSPPGVLTSLGAAAPGIVGRLHFAGADYSAEWPGYMDGAIRSGEASARDALAAL